jgi:DNA (cytosine-5)-methyltransferase 1
MPDKGNLGAVVVPHPVCAEISPTVTNGQPFSRTGNERVECDALVTYGIPGNWIGRAPENGGNATTPMDNVAPCLTSADRHGVATIAPPHVFKIRGGCEGGGKGYLGQDEQAFTILAGDTQSVAVPLAYDMKQHHNPQPTETVNLTTENCSNVRGDTPLVQVQYAVRRLTPVECERLQGFPDGYTNIPWRNKPEAPDGPRYKALGNSWAVPVARWIGERINACL